MSRRSWVEQIMGLPISLLARGDAAASDAAERAVADVYDELREVDAVFSPYREDSEVSRIAAGDLRLEDSRPVVREVAVRCEELRVMTGGLFDATTPAGAWDPSGFVKGWAAQRAMRHLACVEVDWCLNAGGDVAVACPSQMPFVVGVQDPRDDARIAASVPVISGGVATSGTAARGAHLYDPRNGQAAKAAWASVTVMGPELEVADVLATAAFVSAESWIDVLGMVDAYEGLAIDHAGDLHPSAGWPGRLNG